MKKGHTREFWFNEEKVRTMGELYDDGFSLAEIGERHGISRQRVDQLFNKYGIERSKINSLKIAEKRFVRLKLIPKQVLVDLYSDKNIKIADIVERLKISYDNLYKNLTFHKIPRRHKGKQTPSSLTYELLHKLYIEEGLKAHEIAEKLGKATKTIQNRLMEFRIKKF